MDFLETVTNRQSIRKYSNYIPPVEDIKHVIDCARMAPSSHNKQMWHFVAIYNKNIIDKLCKAVENKYEEFKKLPEAADLSKKLEFSKKFSTFFNQAPVVIAVFMKPTSNTVQQILETRNTSRELIMRYRPGPDFQSLGAAIENLLLAATDKGYGACWCTAPIVAYEEMEKIIDFDPEYSLVALLPFGKPDTTIIHKQAQKKTLEEILTIIE